jgi:outer membrane murein-binding lipoprotein Lpp
MLSTLLRAAAHRLGSTQREDQTQCAQAGVLFLALVLGGEALMLRAVVVAACVALAGCDDGKRKSDAETATNVRQENAERSKEFAAKREAEERLFRSSPAATIERRLEEWITARYDLLILPAGLTIATRPDRKTEGMVAVPASTAWFVSCGRAGLSVSVGPWMESAGRGDDRQLEPMFGLLVTPTRLTDQECQEAIDTAGVWMSQHTRKR